MEQLTKNQAVATSQEAVQNQNEPQLRDENAHNDKSVHGVYQAVATSQEAVQNQNEPQLLDENAHNDKSVHGVLNPTYQAGLRRDAVQPDIEAERKKRDEIEA